MKVWVVVRVGVGDVVVTDIHGVYASRGKALAVFDELKAANDNAIIKETEVQP